MAVDCYEFLATVQYRDAIFARIQFCCFNPGRHKRSASLESRCLAIVSQRKAYFALDSLSTSSNPLEWFVHASFEINLSTLTAAPNRHVIHINNVPPVMEGNARYLFLPSSCMTHTDHSSLLIISSRIRVAHACSSLQPEGLKESSRRSEQSEDLRKVGHVKAPRRGARKQRLSHPVGVL